MSRYVFEKEFEIPKDALIKMMNNFINQNEFFLTHYQDEGVYKSGKSSLVRYFKWSYENGKFSLEAWTRQKLSTAEDGSIVYSEEENMEEDRKSALKNEYLKLIKNFIVSLRNYYDPVYNSELWELKDREDAPQEIEGDIYMSEINKIRKDYLYNYNFQEEIRSDDATLSMILGIVGVVFAFLLTPIGLISGLMAIICTVKLPWDYNKYPRAITGRICGVIAMIASVFYFFNF